MPERGTRTPSERVAGEVLDAALAVLEENGPAGFTVRAITQRAGVAPMALYNHFGGINGVLDALWIRGFVAFREAVSISTDDPGADLFEGALRYRAFALENRGLYTLMFMHRFRGFAPSHESLQVAVATFETLVDMVERCRRAGVLRSRGPATDTAQAIWSACHGFVALEIQDMSYVHRSDQAFLHLLATLREGLRA